ncbi:nucleoredoxin-like protein 1 [Aplochiton taeniatus]
MVDLFLGRVLVKNNWDRDELDTEREIIGCFQNRIVLLFFGSAECKRCRDFTPTLKDFFKHLKDLAYIERSAQFVLVYISVDQSEEHLECLLKELPKKCLFLTNDDPYRRELRATFEVKDVPTVVVMRPDGSVLSQNAAEEISSLGTDCYHNWKEGAQLVDNGFMLNEEFEDSVSIMVEELFLDRVLFKNNRDRDKLDTEREIVLRLQNRIMLLFFGAAKSEPCQEFAPTLKDFFKQLTDEFYVERSAQVVLLYISLDESEEQLDTFLDELPKRCLFLAHEDPYRRELEAMFEVEDLPTAVVLRPDGSVLSPNAVEEICSLGTSCFRNWQEGSELIDRNFLINEAFDEQAMRSFTDPVRRLKYKVEDEKAKKNRKKRGWGQGGADEEKEKDGGKGKGEGGGGGGGGGPWG